MAVLSVMIGAMRYAAPLVVLVLGCASTVVGTVGDASDAAVAPIDAPQPSNFELTVLVDLRVPGAPGVDVPVRVEARDGPAVDARTGSDGRVRLLLDPARTYDVTAAQAGHVAVSLLGVRVPFSTMVRMPPQVPTEAPETRRVSFPVTVSGRSAPRSAVVLDGASGTTVARDDTVTLSVATWSDAPRDFFLAAIELDDASNLLRAGFVSVPSRAAPGRVALALTMSPRTDRLRVQFPFVGRVTPSTFGSATLGSVLRFKQTELGESAAPVGRSTLAPPNAAGDAVWTVTRFDAPLDPELSTITFATRETPVLEATVTMQPPFAGLVPMFSPVARLATRAPSPGAFAFTADVGFWSRAYFEVRSVDGTVRWRGFALEGASWTDRALPALPAGVMASSILGRAAIRGRTCVARDAPQMGQLPWAHTRPPLSFWSRLSVCDEGATTAAP